MAWKAEMSWRVERERERERERVREGESRKGPTFANLW
jgi:hypothetical protein